MKVYTLNALNKYAEYSDEDYTMAIFSTREKAEEAKALKLKEMADAKAKDEFADEYSFFIEEYELDKIEFDVSF